MERVIGFLKDISRNNNREWFNTNKKRYQEALEVFNDIAVKLLEGVSAFDPSVRGLELKDITYRIYRDVRFSLNKDPYKNHMGVYICRGGKKSGYAGYYFHVEPVSAGGGPAYFMSSGLYMPQGKVLQSVREEISDNYNGIMEALRKAKGFELDRSNMLKRVPNGYQPGNPYDEMLKLKDIYVVKPFDEKFLRQDDLAGAVSREFGKTYDFIELINRAVTYAYEEM